MLRELCARLSKLPPCTVVKRLEHGDWQFTFSDAGGFTVSCPWRIMHHGQIALGRDDNRQTFGRKEPLDGEAEALSLLGNSPVSAVEIVDGTSDLRISFASGAVLEVFNLSRAYEGWNGAAEIGGRALLFVACGGGDLAIWDRAKDES